MIEFRLPWCDQDQFVFHEGFPTDAPITHWTFDEADIHFAVEEKLHYVTCVAAAQRELDCGILGQKCSSRGRTYCAMVVETPSDSCPETFPSLQPSSCSASAVMAAILFAYPSKIEPCLVREIRPAARSKRRR